MKPITPNFTPPNRWSHPRVVVHGSDGRFQCHICADASEDQEMATEEIFLSDFWFVFFLIFQSDSLGGGLKHVLFLPLFGEMIPILTKIL